MKLLKRILLFTITVLLLATSVMPAVAAPHLASEVALEILNKTQGTVDLVLRGPTDLDLTITRNFTVVRVEPGLYTYRYKACGLRRTGTFHVGSGGATFKLLKCEKGANSTVNIENQTGHTFSLSLFGPKHYALIIKPGDNKITLLAGSYQYSTNACGAIEKGTKNFKSNHASDWVWNCD